jgi:hypothetical protein
MVGEIKKENKTYFACKICKFAYEDKDWAEKCEAWCDEHHSCNIEITKHAISLN